jgi:glutamate racemase
LGCTHYPFLEPTIRRIVGPDVRILDPSPAIAQQVAHVLEELALPAQRRREGQQRFVTSGPPGDLAAALQRLLDLEAPVHQFRQR